MNKIQNIDYNVTNYDSTYGNTRLELNIKGPNIDYVVLNTINIQSKLLEKIKNPSTNTSKSIQSVFCYIIDRDVTNEIYQSKSNDFYNGYEETITHDMSEMGYKKFLDKSLSPELLKKYIF